MILAYQSFSFVFEHEINFQFKAQKLSERPHSFLYDHGLTFSASFPQISLSQFYVLLWKQPNA